MKKSVYFLSLSTVIASIACAGLINIDKANKVANAYDTSSLPKTINLNDTSEADIRNYYSGISGLNGNNLLIHLKTLLSTGQKYYSYDRGNSIWDMYEIIDRDWEKSPAVSSDNANYNYDASSNIITNYQYEAGKTALTDTQKNPYVRALYVDRSVDNEMRAWGNHNQTPWGINREHIWPKSWGFDSSGNGGARGDPMHLWAGDGLTNNMHSNFYYGNVDTSKSYSKSKDKGNDNAKASYTGENYLGTSLTLGSGTVFEPQDSDKGDIARAVFYMAARYNNLSGLDNSISTDNPNLVLGNYIETTTGTSTATRAYSLGVLTDLLEWNKLDPVDDFEIHRNNLLYTNFTNNRNPFIDFPQWADIIWGGDSGTANPSSDVLNNNQGSLRLTLSSSNLALNPKNSLTINASTSDKLSHIVSWISSDTNVVTVSDASTTDTVATVTAISEGNAIITATVVVEGITYTAKCNVSVTLPERTDIKTFEINPTDYTDGYSSSGTSGSISKTLRENNDTIFTYNGINTKGSTGNTYNYTQFVRDNGYIYSSKVPFGFYPSNVTLTVTKNTSKYGVFGVTFDENELSERNNEVFTTINENETTYSFDNTDESLLYWNLSTKGANVQVSKIEVTYKKLEPTISVSDTKIEGNVGETFAVSISTTNLGDDISYLWESEDNSIAEIVYEDNEALIEIKGDGETSIEVSADNGYDIVSASITVIGHEVYSGSSFVIDGNCFNLTTTATTTETTGNYEGTNYVLSKGARSISSSKGGNKFSNNAILIGKKDAYIYNSSSLKSRITKFKIYANYGASAKVEIALQFSDAPITSLSGSNYYTQTLSTTDYVYNVDPSYFEDCTYFRFQILNGYNAQIQFEITCLDISLENVEIYSNPSLTTYYEGELFNPSGLVVREYYDDESTIDVSYNEFSSLFIFDISLDTPLTIEDTTIGFTYASVHLEIAITVNEPFTIDELVIENQKQFFTLNEVFSFDGEITLKYSNGESLSLSSSDVTFSIGEVELTLGTTYITSSMNNATVTVSYYDEFLQEEVSSSYQIFVFLDSLTTYDNVSYSFDDNYGDKDKLAAENIAINDADSLSVNPSKGSGSNAPTYYNATSSIIAAARFYKNNTLTINTLNDEQSIYRIVFTFGTTIGNITASSGSYYSGSWNTGNYTSSVTFTFGGATHIKEIKIYYYSETNFAEQFLTNTHCDPSGYSRPIVGWSLLENKYTNNLLDCSKEILTNATTFGDDIISLAMARYDYIVGKYGTKAFNDFINRDPVPFGNLGFTIFDYNNENFSSAGYALTITAIISICSLSYLYLRKKHKNY